MRGRGLAMLQIAAEMVERLDSAPSAYMVDVCRENGKELLDELTRFLCALAPSLGIDVENGENSAVDNSGGVVLTNAYIRWFHDHIEEDRRREVAELREELSKRKEELDRIRRRSARQVSEEIAALEEKLKHAESKVKKLRGD